MAPLPGRVVSAAEIQLMINLVDIVLASGVDIIIEGFDQFQPPQFPVIHQPPQETNTEILQAREDLMEAIQAFLKKYDHIPPREKSMALLLAEERFLKIKQALEEEHNQPEDIQELLLKLINDLQILNGIQLKQEEQAAKESSIPLRDIISKLPLSVAIAPDLPIMDSLIMKDEQLNTILEMESDEENESSVKDLNLTPSESEDLSDNEKTDSSCSSFRVSGDICFTPSSGSSVAKRSLVVTNINVLGTRVLNTINSIRANSTLIVTYIGILFETQIHSLGVTNASRGFVHGIWIGAMYSASVGGDGRYFYAFWKNDQSNKPMSRNCAEPRSSVEEGGFHVHLEMTMCYIAAIRVSDEEVWIASYLATGANDSSKINTAS
ncbi:hypothetical protein Tco_1204795 [Tanacetum coccineum]